FWITLSPIRVPRGVTPHSPTPRQWEEKTAASDRPAGMKRFRPGGACAAGSARSADSRPEPGPATSTSSVRMPCSIAFLAASSAATCAANGVDLREPLKPLLPDDDQAIALPC